jgi:CPA2 family monovalent cation:H+ antiporter-2
MAGEEKFRMHPTENLLLDLAVCLTAALVCGCLATRFRFSPIVGYLVAGILCGPFTAGYAIDPQMAEQLADIGVVLLMFGVGLNFNLHELFAVRHLAVPGAIIQSLVTTLAVTAASHLMGLSWGQGIIVGLAFSVASTAVLARMLTDHHYLATPAGHLAMGWLVVEDIFTVVVLILLPLLAAPQSGSTGGWGLAKELGLGLGKVAVLMLLIGVLGVRLVPWLLKSLAGSREMFNLAVPVVALGIAWVSAEFFSVSLALGSFLAGVVAGQSRLVERIEATLGPLRDPFTALFFLSIGTLLDPQYVIEHPLGLLFALAIILLLKPLIALVLLRVLHQPLHAALVVAIGLGQVGEFSFILIHQASGLKLLPADSGHQLVAAAIISITLNPFLFAHLPRIERRLRKLRILRTGQWVRQRPRRAPSIHPTDAAGS